MTKQRISFSIAVMIFSLCGHAWALSIGPEEFQASRQLACVLAERSLGQLAEEEYGEKTHNLLEEFDEQERDNILAKAIGYYDGLMFEIPHNNTEAVNLRLEEFVASKSCDGSGYQKVTIVL